MSNDQVAWLTPYERRRTLGIYWYNKASDLRGAAGLIWSGMEAKESSATAEVLGLGSGFSFRVACWPVYQMLCGMALELLLKAAIVQSGRAPKATHRLTTLWSEAGLHADDDQRGLLAILTESIVWVGRYPVPKDEADFARLQELQDRYLMDAVTVGSGAIPLRRRNDKLTWDSFNRLWSTAHANPVLNAIFDDG